MRRNTHDTYAEPVEVAVYYSNSRADGLLLTVDGGKLVTGHGGYEGKFTYKEYESWGNGGSIWLR